MLPGWPAAINIGNLGITGNTFPGLFVETLNAKASFCLFFKPAIMKENVVILSVFRH